MIDTSYNTTYTEQKSKSCHCANPKPSGTCCDLVCFERPNYFCGHLLTDTDLSKEQQYVIEKHKLYNRTLHGWGVVCGLRLTCDYECGGILIDEGYAIDDCGNDLVVCEPIRFDVLAKLKEKGYLIGDVAYDPCKPPKDQPNNDHRQCFYVTICYDEEPREFTTPFVSGCAPTLTECEPTRIREGVTFDVLDELPKKTSWLKDLEERLAGCFCIFTKGPFAQALHTNSRQLHDLVTTPGQINTGQYDDLFYELRGLLLLFLRKYPDKYNCKLDDEIRAIIYPDRHKEGPKYGETVRNAFCDLLRLVWQYAISCALGELIPRCPQPDHAGCVVLGTVEVRGNCVTHVCNCPRSYVWSFPNFWQVLVATAFGSLACEEHKETMAQPYQSTEPASNLAGANITNRYTDDKQTRDEQKHLCCAEFDISCDTLLALIDVNPAFLHYAGTETVRAFSNLAYSARSAFNFTNSKIFSPAIFQNLDPHQFERAIELLQIEHVSVQRSRLDPAFVHPVDMMYRSGLATATESRLVVEINEKDEIVNTYAVPLGYQAENTEKLQSRILKAETQATEANQRAQEVERRIAAAEEYIRKLTGEPELSINDIRQRIHDELTRAAEDEAKKAAKKKSRRSRSRPRGPQEEGENG